MFGKNKVQIKKIFNHYMKPFLEEHGFKSYRNKNREIIYQHKIKLDASIGFHINRINSGVDVIIQGGNFQITSTIHLSMLIEGSDRIDIGKRNNEWFYDNDEQFLGALEEQARLLDEWIIDWMLNKKYVDLNIYQILKEKAEEKTKRWEGVSETEKWNILNKPSKSVEEWRKTRFYPKKWKLEDLDKK